jgi:23S rRNA (uridine2552-2'-O)-methyltransferase
MTRRRARGNRWADHYTRKAQKEKYPARSVYKLQEIQKKNRIIAKGNRVLDLGCAPGSWLLYAAELAGPSGRVVGVDLQPATVQLPAHAEARVGDIRELGDDFWETAGALFDVVLSDMAPATTGNKDVDAARSLDLCEAAFAVARQRLAPGGAFVCKIFQGEGFKTFSDAVRIAFKQHKIYKPQSSRKASREIYIIGLGKH